MEQFTEEHAKRLLEKDWLSKVDAGSSTPYLLKFHPSLADLSCVVMVTDTKKVWAEVLNAKLLARRWRLHNARSPEPFMQSEKEDTLRENILELLSKAHTIGGIADLSFEVVESKYSDLCIEVECEAFKWRWETCFVGYQSSSEIISKHLLFPLISLNHLTFSAAEPISEMSDTDVEKTIDKLGRTARRTVDTHIKNALSKPRVATSISRMTAMFNFTADLPRVISIAEKPFLEAIEVQVDDISPPKSARGTSKYNISPKAPAESSIVASEVITKAQEVYPDSATESDDDLLPPANKPEVASRANSAGPSKAVEGAELRQPSRLHTPPLPTRTEIQTKVSKVSSDSDSPQRPIKKIKPTVPDSSDDDSENDHKKPGTIAPGIKRGTRQPIKRGGKRF